MEVGGQRSANDSYLLCKWRLGGPGNHLVSLSHTTWGKHCHISYQPSTLFLINLLMMKGKQFIRDKNVNCKVTSFFRRLVMLIQFGQKLFLQRISPILSHSSHKQAHQFSQTTSNRKCSKHGQSGGKKYVFPGLEFLHPAKPQPAVYIAGYKKCHFVQIATLIWLLLALFPRTAEYTNILEQKKNAN